MGILDRFVGGPAEPSAAERAAAAVGVVARCTACHTVGLSTVRIPLDGHGHVDVCTDPAGCRVRAQAAGIWAASLLVLHAAEAEDEARRIAVDWSRFLGELGAVYGTTPEPPMPNEVCPDPIVHGRQPLRDEFGRHPIVQDTRRCHYCAGWISPGDRHA